jgi:hypothetical protein
VSDSIKRLSDVKKDTPAILSLLKGGGNVIRDAEALLDSRVEGLETKMVGGDHFLCLEEETNWPVGGWVVSGFKNNCGYETHFIE